MLPLLAGCGGAGAVGGPSTSGGGRGGATLTVFAAASLTDAFGQLAKDFERQHPGVRVRNNFNGSSTLAAQIEQGAPADVFASADTQQMRRLQKKGLIAGKPRLFARNREVVIVPRSNPAHIRVFKDLAKPGVKLVLAAKGVPAAVYAMQILGKAARDPSYGSSFKKGVLSNIVSREQDVRAAVSRVATGDADATFCYASDVTPDVRGKVRVIEIPRTLNVVATYPIAVVKGSKNEKLAREWVDLVTSQKGQKVLEKWGFMPASG
ncbi:molybdate ABC transporter substrate-binding protein [Rubrobacter naiadicus]|uniref:molybdate ABC transporter substrate-binding protein n=1 Tax=Rubrobacter naiadicus TaxID=1392641 RepID=UPI00235FBCA3|nr:molybdate ABC transporter substrate-binding protein [Rubrobacter naiadicus]